MKAFKWRGRRGEGTDLRVMPRRLPQITCSASSNESRLKFFCEDRSPPGSWDPSLSPLFLPSFSPCFLFAWGLLVGGLGGGFQILQWMEWLQGLKKKDEESPGAGCQVPGGGEQGSGSGYV